MDFETSASGTQRFRYNDAGDGPVVVLLHGFPDEPESWSETSSALVAGGYRTITPYLRGFHPDTIVPGRAYGAAEIGGDVLALLDMLDIESAVLVGHDFGASAAWSAVASAPDRVGGIVAIAIPHPASLKPSLSLLWQTRHFGYFKLPMSDQRTARNDLAYIDTLYGRWAPDWSGPDRDATVARGKEILRDPVVRHEVLQWYRDLSLKPNPANDFQVSCPGLLVVGANDFDDVVSAFDRSVKQFDGPVDVLTIPGAGHWPQREGIDDFHAGLLNFLPTTQSD